MNFQRSGRKIKMTSCGEAVNEPLEEAASKLTPFCMICFVFVEIFFYVFMSKNKGYDVFSPSLCTFGLIFRFFHIVSDMIHHANTEQSRLLCQIHFLPQVF